MVVFVKKKKIRRINYQKIFCFVSFIFILVCFLWYGGRFIYFYVTRNQDKNQNNHLFAQVVKVENQGKKTFRKSGDTYYFYQNVKNNYVRYSNLIWRIVKINSDQSMVLILDQLATTLAFGTESTYQDSNILKWLNKTDDTNSGLLEQYLVKPKSYLIQNSVCIDSVKDVKHLSCKKKGNNYYLDLLSVEDYIKTGGTKSFIHDGSNSYLANTNSENEVWYLDENGKLDTTDGSDLMGIKPIITLSPTVEVTNGTGSSDDPYQVGEDPEWFGSYVKLGDDLYRVYGENEQLIQLVSQDFLKVNGEVFQHSYSSHGYYHNDTIYGSLAYYLNHTFFNQLSYHNLIVESSYRNGYYGSTNQFNLDDIYNHTVDTKVSIPSVGDIILNPQLNSYLMNTGLSADSSSIYLYQKNGMASIKNVLSENNIIYCISIPKNQFKGGSGKMDDPYRTE